MLRVTDLTYRIAGRTLLERASMALPAGHHAGLVGRNGAGKSTLLKLIAGELSADGGEIGLPKRTRIGMLAQEAPGGPESLLETVLAADRERSALTAEAEEATDPHRIADIHARLADIGAHSAPARAASILAGLGFDEAAQARPCHEFSGGWRIRVALAAVLFSEPDLLLLDEPTNHLDLEATLWLESFLKDYPRTILLISHDRDLLNKVVDKIVHLENGKLTVYTGAYDTFQKTRSERLANQAAARAKQIAQREHMQAFIDRFRAKASKARQAQSRIKALERMEPIAAPLEERTVSFNFPQPDELPPPLISMDGVVAGYEPGKPVLSRLRLRLDMDDRIALLGANGNGKSTLAKILAGRLAPLSGTIHRSRKLRVGYFAQHQTDEMDETVTPLVWMERIAPKSTNEKRRAHLGRFGFTADHMMTKIGALSGGEKARLLFALICLDEPHILLLDEPTNHLDIDSRQALVDAINDYAGAVVLISHDPYLIELTADQLWLVADGTCRAFDGDLDDYRRLLLSERRKRGGGKRKDAAVPVETPAPERKEKRKPSAQNRAAQEAAQRLSKLQARAQALEQQLADPAVYQGPKTKLIALQVEFAQLKKDAAKAEQLVVQMNEAAE